MRKVLFLDRDGVINMERGTYTFLKEDFKYTPKFWENCKTMQSWGYDFIVITNQGGISKGLYTIEHVLQLNQMILQDAQSHDVRILDIFFCPHHSVNEKCLCRKPDSLMLEKACAKYQVIKEESYFVGDNVRDVEAGEKAGLKSIFLEKNNSLETIFTKIKNG